VIPDMEAMVGNTLQRILTDKGIPRPQRAARLQVQDLHLRPETGRDTPDQTPVAPQVRRRAGHGHLKVQHRMSRNYLWYRRGDAANAVLAAAGYNFHRLIRWLSILWRLVLSAFLAAPQPLPV